MTAHIVFCDSESDGLRADRRTWEVALIHRDPTADAPDTEVTIIITDSGVTGAEEPDALRINRYEERFNRQLASGEVRRTGYQAALMIQQLTWGAWLVAAQPQFDVHGLTRLLDWYGLKPGWKRRLRDIEGMVEAHLGRFGVGGLQACAEALHIDVDPSVMHTSLGDARLVRACFDRIFDPQLPF